MILCPFSVPELQYDIISPYVFVAPHVTPTGHSVSWLNQQMTGMRKQRSSSLWALLGQNRGPELKPDGTAQGSPEVKPPVKTTRRFRIVLVFLWLYVITVSFSYIMLTTVESPFRREMAAGLFFGYGFLVAMHAKKLKPLWFFAGGVAAIIAFGVLDGLIRRVLHGLPIFT